MRSVLALICVLGLAGCSSTGIQPTMAEGRFSDEAIDSMPFAGQLLEGGNPDPEHMAMTVVPETPVTVIPETPTTTMPEVQGEAPEEPAVTAQSDETMQESPDRMNEVLVRYSRRDPPETPRRARNYHGGVDPDKADRWVISADD